MAQRGGKRPGAGRPQSAPTRLTRVRAHEIAQSGFSPLDVMLGNMKFWLDQTEHLATKLGELFDMNVDGCDPDAVATKQAEGAKLIGKLLAARQHAQDCAVDAAPYVHPKLQSITLKPSTTETLIVTMTLDKPSVDEDRSYRSPGLPAPPPVKEHVPMSNGNGKAY